MTPEQSAAVERCSDELADVMGVAFVHRDDLKAVLAALDEAQKDAARYGILRSGEHLQFSVLASLTEPAPVVSAAQGWEEIEGDDMDAAIDAARASAGGAA